MARQSSRSLPRTASARASQFSGASQASWASQMSRAPHSSPSSQASSPSQASQASRQSRSHAWRIVGAIVLLLAGLAAISVSLLCLFNYSAQRSYDSLSSELRSNVTAAQRGSRKVSDIQASQQRVSAGLDDLSSSTSVQVPQLASAVSIATKTSHRLDALLSKMATGQKWDEANKSVKKDAQNKKRAQSSTSSQKSSQKSPSTSSQSTQQDEQEKKQQEQERKQLDRLVSQTQSSTTSTVRPW